MKFSLTTLLHSLGIMLRSILKFNPCLRTPDPNFLHDDRVTFTAPSSAYALMMDILKTAPEFKDLLKGIKTPHLLRMSMVGDRIRVNIYRTESMAFPGLPVYSSASPRSIFHALYDGEGGLRSLQTAFDVRWTYNPHEVEYSFEYALESEDLLMLSNLITTINPEYRHVPQVA